MQFFVSGIPAPQGSKRHVGNGIMVEQAGPRLKAWRDAVRVDCGVALRELEPFTGPIKLRITFQMPRPKDHYVSHNPARGLKPTAPLMHIKAPDIDKLLRSTLDGLMFGGAYLDDSQVCAIDATKSYAVDKVGAWVTIQRLVPEEHRSVANAGVGV